MKYFWLLVLHDKNLHFYNSTLKIFQILIETRSLQKEINQASGKLNRTFTATDEMIFKVCICLYVLIL